ncbi:hypothetical protein AX15_004338 [Amanita polypyramis BW_CC]|nr:hypothetical protein AX15_004338 [Amanita polypyramis BW_CC]
MIPPPQPPMVSLTLTRHERFYYQDGNFKLQIDDTEYQVHMYLFKIHASKFPFTGKKHAHNLSNERPYRIGGVSQADFDRLLACLYPAELMFEDNRTLEDWTTILKLASRWGFDSLRKRAVSEIDNLASPVDRVVLGHEYSISEFLLPAYLALCQSSIPLSEEEGDRLGMKNVINIYRVRHELWGQSNVKVSTAAILKKVETYFDTTAHPSPPLPPIIASPTISNESGLLEGHGSDAIPEKLPSSGSDFFPIDLTQSLERPIEPGSPLVTLDVVGQTPSHDDPKPTVHDSLTPIFKENQPQSDDEWGTKSNLKTKGWMKKKKGSMGRK